MCSYVAAVSVLLHHLPLQPRRNCFLAMLLDSLASNSVSAMSSQGGADSWRLTGCMLCCGVPQQVRHKNVVQFIGACTRKPNLCIVFEYMSGGSVYDWIRREGPLKLSQVRMGHTPLLQLLPVRANLLSEAMFKSHVACTGD